MCLPFFSKGAYSKKKKEFATNGSKFFSLRVDSFSEVFETEILGQYTVPLLIHHLSIQLSDLVTSKENSGDWNEAEQNKAEQSFIELYDMPCADGICVATVKYTFKQVTSLNFYHSLG